MINKLKNTIILLFILIILSSCKGIEFEDSSFSHAVELTRGEAMILVADEKNNYENKFGHEVWLLKSGDGRQDFKNYVVLKVKEFVEDIMLYNLVAKDLGVEITDSDKKILTEASEEYYNNLSDGDKSFIGADLNDVYNIFSKFRVANLLVGEFTKNDDIELSISETKVILVQYIVFEDKETAESIKEKLKQKNASFLYFAKTYTKDEDNNIDMVVKRGDETSIRFPEIFFLADGEVSDVLSYRGKYYIFKCIDDYLEKETEDRRIEILEKIRRDGFNNTFKNYESMYNVKSSSDYWNNIDLSKGENCTVMNFYKTYNKYFE